MKPDHFSAGASIRTIENALLQARAEKTNAAYYYKLWGIVLSIHYLLLFSASRFPGLKGGVLETIIWGVFPVAGLLSYLRSKKDARKEKALSLYEKVYLFAFGGFALSFGWMFIMTAATQSRLQMVLFPLLIGVTVFVVGGITKHRASVAGGAAAIVCAGISANASLEMQYILAALAALVSCMIPGFLMSRSNV